MNDEQRKQYAIIASLKWDERSDHGVMMARIADLERQLVAEREHITALQGQLGETVLRAEVAERRVAGLQALVDAFPGMLHCDIDLHQAISLKGCMLIVDYAAIADNVRDWVQKRSDEFALARSLAEKEKGT